MLTGGGGGFFGLGALRPQLQIRVETFKNPQTVSTFIPLKHLDILVIPRNSLVTH
jgi:hypothetical protein